MWHDQYPRSEHQARVLLGDPVALAYEWISRYAENLTVQVQKYNEDDEYGNNEDITADDLISTADSHQGDRWGDYISRGGTFEGESVDPTFWKHYATIKGLEVEDVVQSSFFSCYC
ncbi:hypothetical protein CH29_gp27 [Achromobacter phage JWAlpha]|uniref:Uncharacterized protein n=1 Tax=Achromobacter phage JWAlpha TaxID=1416009 RepID=V9VF64_9CAUD|nr:hypothetical protein CH29_gp27 [Achromobacter phage JWAlpha]AHC93980.1 hypothetical protein JJJB_0027 [Achromobacter phage JWAlpha]